MAVLQHGGSKATMFDYFYHPVTGHMYYLQQEDNRMNDLQQEDNLQQANISARGSTDQQQPLKSNIYSITGQNIDLLKTLNLNTDCVGSQNENHLCSATLLKCSCGATEIKESIELRKLIPVQNLYKSKYFSSAADCVDPDSQQSNDGGVSSTSGPTGPCSGSFIGSLISADGNLCEGSMGSNCTGMNVGGAGDQVGGVGFQVGGASASEHLGRTYGLVESYHAKLNAVTLACEAALQLSDVNYCVFDR